MAIDIDENEFDNADVMVGFKVTQSERDDLQEFVDLYNEKQKAAGRKGKATLSKIIRHIVVKAIK